MTVFNMKLVDDWVSFWNTYNLSILAKLFLNDRRVSYFSSEKQGAFYGFEALMEHHMSLGFVPGGREQSNKLWLEDTRADELGGLVLVTAVWYFQRQDNSIQRGPVTLVCVEVDNSYRIAHANFGNY